MKTEQVKQREFRNGMITGYAIIGFMVLTAVTRFMMIVAINLP